MAASTPGTVALTVEFDGAVQAIVFSPDSARVAAGGGDSVLRIRVIGTGPVLDIPVEGFVASIAYSPDGTAVAIADLDQIFVRDANTGAVRWQGPVESGSSVNAVAFTSDGRTLVAATDRTVATFGAADGAPGMSKVVEQQIAGMDVSADGTKVALAIDERHGGNHHNAGSARVLDLATGAERGRLTPANAVFDVAFSPDGRWVLCGSADGTTRMFESDGGKELWSIENGASHLAFDPRGTWVVIGGADERARVLEAESGVEKCRADHEGAVTRVAFAPNGLWAASGGIDGVVHVLSVKSERDRYTLRTGEEMGPMRFSADSRWLGFGTFNRAVVVDNGVP